jgi:hypothetical protein
MSAQLASWVGEHSRASYRGRAVLIQYALASLHDGTPAADVTRDDLIRRTGLGRDSVVYGRNEVLGRPTMVGGGRNGDREVPGLACPELEELEAPGGRGRSGRYRPLFALCPRGKKCWSCDALAKALGKPRPRPPERVRPGDGSGAAQDLETVGPADGFEETTDAETVGPGDGFAGGAEPGNRRADSRNRRAARPTTVTAPPVGVSGDAGLSADNPDPAPDPEAAGEAGRPADNPHPEPGTTGRAAQAASLPRVDLRGASKTTPAPRFARHPSSTTVA